MSFSLYGSVAGYAERFHRLAGDGHHIASPLGAWLLLALCAPAAGSRTRAELEEVLGADAVTAGRAAAELLASPHPLVAAAAAVWQRPDVQAKTEANAWLQGLPSAVAKGVLPAQAELDEWARRKTFGLIERFPLQVRPTTLLMLATALATKVTWQVPFALAPGAELGAASRWSALEHVLRSPSGRWHRQYIASTRRAGDVAVHFADAAGDTGGLRVLSVIAEPEVPAIDVLAAAHEVAGGAAQKSLFDLPLGDRPMWTIREEEAERLPSARVEVCEAVLPAWSARSEHKLDDPEFGFQAAGRAVTAELDLGDTATEATQAAMAKYTRTGFEAAAVTAMGLRAASMMREQKGVRRVAQLRFAHPYAVVAVAREDGSPWNDLPVFSAWVADPSSATE
jgi:hypothetical protein